MYANPIAAPRQLLHRKLAPDYQVEEDNGGRRPDAQFCIIILRLFLMRRSWSMTMRRNDRGKTS